MGTRRRGDAQISVPHESSPYAARQPVLPGGHSLAYMIGGSGSPVSRTVLRLLRM
jgi:hypothetical protein